MLFLYWYSEVFPFLPLSPFLFKRTWLPFLSPLYSLLFLLHPWRESAILSQSLDECQARFGVVGLSYVKTCLRVCFAAKQGSVSLEQSRQRLTWLRFVGTALLLFFPPKLFGCRFLPFPVPALSLSLSLLHLYFFWVILSFNFTYNDVFLTF